MRWWRTVSEFFQSYRQYLPWLVVGVAAAVFGVYLQAIPTFPDPDSFYHVKMARMIAERGVITEFPWLQVSVLKDSYINQHFLYHTFLIPFTWLPNPLLGAKLAQVFLMLGFFLLFYGFLRSHRVKFALLFTLILMGTTAFTFRLNLVKAPVVSLLFLTGGLWCLFRYRYKTLFFLSVAYVWAYGGFIVLLIAAGLYAGVSVMTDWLRSSRLTFLMAIRHSRALRLFGITTLGMVAGILINPHFPHNLFFYWNQLVKIGIVNYQNVISVGNEWYPYNVLDLVTGTGLVTLLVVCAIIIVIATGRAPSKKLTTLFLLFLFFLAFTLKSRRYVEYFVPMATLFAAFGWHHFFGTVSWRWLRRHLFLAFRHYRVAVIMVGVYLLVAVPAIIAKDFTGLVRDYRGGIPLTRFQEAGAWLEENSLPGDIVFHSSWDEFPVLFYWNSRNYYIAGLDPTFTYEYDRERYRAMVELTTGRQRENVLAALRDDFHARYIFIEKNHDGMEQAVSGTPGFRRVYEDDEAMIYDIIDRHNP